MRLDVLPPEPAHGFRRCFVQEYLAHKKLSSPSLVPNCLTQSIQWLVLDSQLPHKSVYLRFQSVRVDNTLKNLWGSWLSETYQWVYSIQTSAASRRVRDCSYHFLWNLCLIKNRDKCISEALLYWTPRSKCVLSRVLYFSKHFCTKLPPLNVLFYGSLIRTSAASRRAQDCCSTTFSESSACFL